jgi:hypothetical protein
MKRKGDIVLRVLGIALGLAAAASLVLSSRIPPGTGTLGADVILASSPTGELGVSPVGPFLSATNLSPSDRDVPAGDLLVTNQTGVALDVQVRGVPSTTDMDTVLHVRVAADGEPLFDGMLGEFRTWSTADFSLASGDTGDVEVTTWLDPADGQSWSGRIATVGVEFRSTPPADVSGAAA